VLVAALLVAALPFRQGLAMASQVSRPPSTTTTRIQPRAVVPTPMYLSPDAKMTKVMMGRITLSGAREDRNEPTRTAGMLPITIEAVTANWTCPNSSAPAAAARVSGTAWVRSVPTSCPADSTGYRNIIITIISEPEPTEVMPTMMPPMAPMAMVSGGRMVTSLTVASRCCPLRQSST